jgi:hypothetical protein
VSTEVTFWHSKEYGSDFRLNSGEIPRNSAEFRGISPELSRNHFRSQKIPRNSVSAEFRGHPIGECHLGPKKLEISRAQPHHTCPSNGCCCCPHQKHYARGHIIISAYVQEPTLERPTCAYQHYTLCVHTSIPMCAICIHICNMLARDRPRR